MLIAAVTFVLGNINDSATFISRKSNFFDSKYLSDFGESVPVLCAILRVLRSLLSFGVYYRWIFSAQSYYPQRENSINKIKDGGK